MQGCSRASWAVLYRGLTAPSPHRPKQEALLPAVVALHGLSPLGRLGVDPALLPCFLPTLCEVAALFIGSRLSVGARASSRVLGILLPDWCSFPLVFILFQRWKLGLRTVGSGGLEPGHVQRPCPVGNQGLLQTLGARELCDWGWGRGLQREVDWTPRRAAHTPPLGFPGVGSEMWGVGAPLHIHPWCACVLGHTHLLHTSTHRSPPTPQHDPTPGPCRPCSWLRGSHACSLGAVLGRPLGPSEAELVLRAESGTRAGRTEFRANGAAWPCAWERGQAEGGDRGPEGI